MVKHVELTVGAATARRPRRTRPAAFMQAQWEHLETTCRGGGGRGPGPAAHAIQSSYAPGLNVPPRANRVAGLGGLVSAPGILDAGMWFFGRGIDGI